MLNSFHDFMGKTLFITVLCSILGMCSAAPPSLGLSPQASGKPVMRKCPGLSNKLPHISQDIRQPPRNSKKVKKKAAFRLPFLRIT